MFDFSWEIIDDIIGCKCYIIGVLHVVSFFFFFNNCFKDYINNFFLLTNDEKIFALTGHAY